MVRVAVAWALLLLVVPAAALAQVEKRIALLIGNQSYTPEIDLLQRTHKGRGFEVAALRDADLAALTRAVNAYARRLAGGGQDADQLSDPNRCEDDRDRRAVGLVALPPGRARVSPKPFR
jgi:hypothetical protein